MGTTTMDGTEQVLFESTELGEYSGYIFLDKLQTNDKVNIKVYVKDVEEDSYKLWVAEEYAGPVTCPALRMEPMIGKVGMKVSVQQTAGTYRTVTHMWFKR